MIIYLAHSSLLIAGILTYTLLAYNLVEQLNN